MQNSIELNIRLQILIKQEEEVWVAECPSLEIATQANTEEKAFAAIDEAVKGWFDSCLDRGVLREALLELGFLHTKNGEAVPEGAESISMQLIEPVGPVTEKELQISIPAYMAHSISSLSHAIN